jgi:hypothetical protein
LFNEKTRNVEIESSRFFGRFAPSEFLAKKYIQSTFEKQTHLFTQNTSVHGTPGGARKGTA